MFPAPFLTSVGWAAGTGVTAGGGWGDAQAVGKDLSILPMAIRAVWVSVLGAIWV